MWLGSSFLFITENIALFGCTTIYSASLMAQMIKNLPVMQEAQLRFLDQEDPLKKGMATHSSILAWEIPWRSLMGAIHGLQRV